VNSLAFHAQFTQTHPSPAQKELGGQSTLSRGKTLTLPTTQSPANKKSNDSQEPISLLADSARIGRPPAAACLYNSKALANSHQTVTYQVKSLDESSQKSTMYFTGLG
jgi:hypothetical protein